jgi:gamma-glutamyltranspeptidase/glutathione hydrolase
MPYALACPEPLAADAGAAAFAGGGNALDAALAAAAALAVTYPHNCGVGGDLFAVVRFSDGRCVSVNASGPAPLGADAEALRRRGSAMPVTGPETITVPGVVRGWERLHAMGARLAWAAAFAAARRIAAEGVRVGRSLALAIEEAEADIAADPGMAAVLRPRGAGLREGETLVQPALAETLGALAARGADELYTGEAGRRLVAGLRGSALREEDLARFAVETTAPLTGRFRDLTLHTSPPNASGVLLLQALAALERAGDARDAPAGRAGEDGRDLPAGGAGLLAQLFRLGAAQRDGELGDPRSAPFDRDAWLGEERLGALARAAARGPALPAAASGPRPGGDTVAVVAADGEGLAVSLIQSLCGSFGARVLEPATGVLLHNRGAYFSLVPGHPNELAPVRRPAHTLMPLIAERDGAFAGALGTMGGKAHAQILAQVLLALHAGNRAQEAVAAPRWVVGGLDLGEPDIAARAEAGLPAAARDALVAAGFDVTDVAWPSEDLGHAQAIWAAGDALDAGSDPRAGGAARTG